MKRIAILFTLFCLVVTIAGCQTKYQSATFTDDMGRAITITEAPQRIVSHVPSITEMLFALGLDDRVVGVSDYCDYPPEAKEKPSVGNYYNPSVENIVALEPDLVLTDGYSNDVLLQLESLGINYIVIQPYDIEDIIRDIELVGQVTGTEQKATRLTKSMRRQIDEVTSPVKDAPRIKVFYVVDMTDPNNPWTAAPGSMIDWLINNAGGDNIVSPTTGEYVQYSIEEIVSGDPDIIIFPAIHGTASVSNDVFLEHPVWSQISAVKQGKMYAIDADLVSRTGPRITQGLLEMAKIIHPELFD